VTGTDNIILRLFEAQKLRIATVYLKLLQQRKSVKEQTEIVRLFRYNPLILKLNKTTSENYSFYLGSHEKVILIFKCF